MSTIKNQRCFTEATASARLILATGLLCLLFCQKGFNWFIYMINVVIFRHESVRRLVSEIAID